MITTSQDGILVMAHSSAAIYKSSSVGFVQSGASSPLVVLVQTQIKALGGASKSENDRKPDPPHWTPRWGRLAGV
jgi:hypothetical protein